MRSSVRARKKSVPFPNFPSRKKTWPTKYDFGLLFSRTARCLSANRSCHKLLTRTTTCPGQRPAGRRNRTQTGIELSSGKYIIHEALAIFRRRATPAPNKPQILLKSKSNRLAHNFCQPASRWSRQTHSAEVMRKKTALDFAPGFTWSRSTTLTSSAQNSAIVHSEAQSTPQFLEGCCWLTGIRT